MVPPRYIEESLFRKAHEGHYSEKIFCRFPNPNILSQVKTNSSSGKLIHI